MAVDKLKCTNCGKTRATEKNFYMSHSHIYSNNEGRIPICKECTVKRFDELVAKHKEELKALYHLCMNLDIYYNNDLATSMYSNMKEKDNLAKLYLPKVNSLQQYKGLTSLDSDMIVIDEDRARRSILEEDSEEVDGVEGFEITPSVLPSCKYIGAVTIKVPLTLESELILLEVIVSLNTALFPYLIQLYAFKKVSSSKSSAFIELSY